MTTTAEIIVTDVSVLLQDINKERWSDEVMLQWITEAQQIIATHKPESVAAKSTIALIAGLDQIMPTDAVMLLKVRRNDTSGIACYLIDEDTMNRSNPSWAAAPAAGDVSEVVYDSKLDPLNFMVSPPNDGTGVIHIVYAKIPAPVTDTTDNLSVSDSFAPLVKDYVAYRCFQMETEGQSVARAGQHLNTFLTGLGMNTQAEDIHDANRELDKNG
jgi:hypothetical protein